VQRGQCVGRGFGDEVVERLVLIYVNDLRPVLAERGCRSLGATAECDRLHVTQLSRLGHQLEGCRLQLALVQLHIHPDLRHA